MFSGWSSIPHYGQRFPHPQYTGLPAFGSPRFGMVSYNMPMQLPRAIPNGPPNGLPFLPPPPPAPDRVLVGGANAVEETLDSIFDVTPFGVCCKWCAVSGKPRDVGNSQRSMNRHLKKHEDQIPLNRIKVSESYANRMKGAEELLRKRGAFDNFVMGTPTDRYVCGCCEFNSPVHAEGKKAMKRHWKRENPCKTKEDIPRQLLQPTVCGRFVNLDSLRHQATEETIRENRNKRLGDSICMPAFDKVTEMIRPLIPEHECVTSYATLLTPLLEHADDVDDALRPLVRMCCDPVVEGEVELAHAIREGDEWLKKTATHLVQRCPGNLRAAIQQFEGTTVDDVNVNFTYNMRRNPDGLKSDLRGLLSFAMRRDTRVRSEICSILRSSCDFKIQNILELLYHESATSLGDHPLVFQYCLLRAFRIKYGELEMVRCNTVGKHAAAVLSLLRAAICAIVASIPPQVNSTAWKSMAHDVVEAARDATVNHLIGPLIRQCKQMDGRKPPTHMVSITAHGISVDEFDFRDDVTSRLVPRIVAKCETILSSILEGDGWRAILDESVPLRVKRGLRHQFEVHYRDHTGQWHSLESVAEVADGEVDPEHMEHFSALMAFCAHGFGGGVARQSEILRCILANALWHNGSIYYSTESIKQYDHFDKDGKLTIHKLPPLIARLFLIFRFLVGYGDSDLMVPSTVCPDIPIGRVAQELYSFHSRPTARQVRQFWTSLMNREFPEGVTNRRSTGESEARMCGHSQKTHRVRYYTVVLDRHEEIYNHFHGLIGANNLDAPRVNVTMEDCFAALPDLYDGAKGFKSEGQCRLVEQTIAEDGGRHLHGGIKPGGGKSSAWIVPIAAAMRAGKQIPSQVVVVPYNQLVCHHVKTAKEKLPGANVVGITSTRVRQGTHPKDLPKQGVLPDLIVISARALFKLHKYHLPILKHWIAEGLITRFFLDEIHTVYGETFRDEYAVYPQIAALGVKITTLTGSLPLEYVNPLLKWLRLDDEGSLSHVLIVKEAEVLHDFPEGFEFKLETCSPRQLVTITSRNVRGMRDKAKQHIHVMCSDKDRAGALGVLLRDLGAVVVTGDTPEPERQRIAAQWSDGEIEILISTTCALVGNENPSCHSVIICGRIYNLMNVLQAVGRIRESQLRDFGAVKIFYPTPSPHELERMKAEDDNRITVLKRKGLLPEASINFRQIGCSIGLHEWSLGTTCRIQSLSKLFGKRTSACMRCDCCLSGICPSSGAERAARQAQVAVRHNDEVRADAANILDRLSRYCPWCRGKECDGTGCIPKELKLCYNCFVPGHYRRACKHKTGEVSAGTSFCHYCLQINEVDGILHPVEDCPMQRRLRRITFEHIRRTKQPTKEKPIEYHMNKFLAEMFADSEIYCQTVVEIKQSHTKRRRELKESSRKKQKTQDT